MYVTLINLYSLLCSTLTPANRKALSCAHFPAALAALIVFSETFTLIVDLSSFRQTRQSVPYLHYVFTQTVFSLIFDIRY